MRGRFAGLLVDWWDWVAPPEAPPQEPPISDTAQCSPLPFGRHNIWLKPLDSENHLVLFTQKINIQYLLFADLPIGLIFKPLFDAGQRHMAVISGNILSETKEKDSEREEQMSQFHPLCLLHPCDHRSKSCYFHSIPPTPNLQPRYQ